ncbi:MAG: hypothetical protein ACKO1I_07780 [Microcystis aeruginosa]
MKWGEGRINKNNLLTTGYCRKWSILFGSPEKIIISQQNHIICHFS